MTKATDALTITSKNILQILKRAKRTLDIQAVGYPYNFYFNGLVYRVEGKGEKPFPEYWTREPYIWTKKDLCQK